MITPFAGSPSGVDVILFRNRGQPDAAVGVLLQVEVQTVFQVLSVPAQISSLFQSLAKKYSIATVHTGMIITAYSSRSNGVIINVIINIMIGKLK